MRYFRCKQIVNDITTLSLKTDAMETSYLYHQDGDMQYWGVQTDDPGFLLSQHPECEVTELTYPEMAPILKSCKMMRDLDIIIETEIAKEYSIGKELKLRDLAANDPERIEYEITKEAIKVPVRAKKVELGLVL